MSSIKVTHIFTVPYEGSEYEVEVNAMLVHDSNYGADADGNRGVPMSFVEDIYATEVVDAEDLDDGQIAEVKALAEKMAEDHDFFEDVPEPQDPEYEDDDFDSYNEDDYDTDDY